MRSFDSPLRDGADAKDAVKALTRTGRVLVIGGGIAGLATALALKRSGREVVILERDPEPPDISPTRAFEDWHRAGVPQFRHAHILLARLQKMLRHDHPELLAELQKVGIALSTADEIAHWIDVGVTPDPDLCNLWGRRATFEYVLRRHVGAFDHVQFVHTARVEGLLTQADGENVRVCGLEVVRGGSKNVIKGDIVVDASGKRSKVAEWLRQEGVTVDTDARPSKYVYLCRHYRLREPDRPPPRKGGGGGNLDYLWYGIFYAEEGHFAVAFAFPVEEEVLGEALKDEAGFDAVCRQIPVVAEWTDAGEVTTGVLGAGRFENRWIRYGSRGGGYPTGLFPVGDAHIQTNPMYGRGCSTAFVQAQAFAQAIEGSDDPTVQARRYYEDVRKLLQTHYDFCVIGDRMFISRAQRARGLGMPFGDRVVDYLYEKAWHPALHSSPLVAEEMLRAMQMLEISGLGRRLRMVLHIFRALLFALFGFIKPPRLIVGPPREHLLRALPPARPRSPSTEVSAQS